MTRGNPTGGVSVTVLGMAEDLPPVGEFGYAFIEFMRTMHEAAVAPEGPWVRQLRAHLGSEPGELPITAKSFRMADRPNLQLALDAVLPDRELIGLPPQVTEGGEGLSGLTVNRGFAGRSRATPVQYVEVEVGDGSVMRCVAGALLLGRFENVPLGLVVAASKKLRHTYPSMCDR